MYYKDLLAPDWENMKNNLPFDYNFRQFKLFVDMENDQGKKERQIIKIPYIVDSFETLKQALLEYEPQHAYISVARFLNPHKVAQKAKNLSKPGYKIANNIFLGAELVVDVDSKREDNKNKIKYFLEREYGGLDFEMKIYKTRRGFHIWILDFQNFINKSLGIIENPELREKKNKEWRVMIADKLKKEGCNFDYQSTIDTRRIVRIPYSIYDNDFIISEVL